jgi:hypothetical protein
VNEHQTTHFLLRRASSCLSDTEKRLLLAEPRTHKEAPEKRKKGKRQEKSRITVLFYFPHSRMRNGELFAFPE